ncbi:MAG TPA: glycosyltransferase family 2 protein [Candidatus Saccharimonadales bacterium]|nr:glycosyltransferase family 2 protein [Candidatus Saccharimonadales bacterium]
MSVEITGLVIAKNEAVDLPDALGSWQSICDALVVVNNESADDTREIALAYSAKVIDACMDTETGFSGLRNAGLETVGTSHVLVFDADERPTPTLLHSIRNAIVANANAAYRFRRRNNALGGWLDHGRFSPDWQIRLFQSDTRYQGKVHELPILSSDTAIVDLEGYAEHFTYRSLGEYVAKMVDYAEKYASEHDAPTLVEAIKAGPRNLIRHHGYRDGWRGVAMAAGDSWQEWMIRRFSLQVEGNQTTSRES